ncbi:hypothetical protein HRJ34_00065 [Rhizorhabdus wittichii]|uniref:Uncharacterized protein n=1 Tax=Rhizorhabdus wittichii TaxID=160791 RepID=A0A975HE55_9SPHN|nr:hypothetical protein [Rhizorhabdus wittichii]QTH21973.1 hypothetical protein HRJ34_00065 [Rhizorhabdus wittichii]
MTDAQPISAVRAAFIAWRDALLTSYYAFPCPATLAEKLYDNAIEAEKALAAAPAETAADVVLKLLPLHRSVNDPPAAANPLRPVVEREPNTHYIPDDFWESLIDDMARVEPLIADAFKAHPSDFYIRRDAKTETAQ